MAEVAVNLVLDRINLLYQELKLLRDVDEEVADIENELESISSFLRDADARAAKEDGNEGLKTWVKHVREAAFRIEDVIDEYILHVRKFHEHPHQHGFKALLRKLDVCLLRKRHEIASEIQHVKTLVRDIRERGQGYSLSTLSSTSAETKTYDPRMGLHFVENDVLVGIDSVKKELVSELIHGESNRTIVSLVGMGGVGKTTLAKKVLEEQIEKGQFDCHAWITVSQSYKVVEILRTMIRLFHKSRKEAYKDSDVNAMDGEELISRIREYLQDKRYVVVFDDVGKEDFWGDIEYALFANDKSSRIVLTTRNENVAHFCKRSSLVHVLELNPLPLELAQELLCKIAFQLDQDKQCPKELKELSFDIAKRCEGLPLAIVAIGGLLSTKGRDVGEWERLHHGLKSELESNIHLTRIRKILSFSYHDLPYHLKSCFLYLGMFPEDYVVNCPRLVRLWIAEGFVKQKQHSTATLEEIAREYLAELIHRNLVQAESDDFDGVIRTCRVHDLMHEVILWKSGELSLIQTSAEILKSSHQIAGHLSIKNASSNSLPRSSGSSKTHSIVFFEVNQLPKSLLKSIFANFKLLKELDFEGVPLKYLPEGLGNLLHLKYLSIRDTKVKSLPKSLAKLQNLETLDLKRSLVHELPFEVNKLSNLQFLIAYSEDYDTRQGVKIRGNVQSLNSLQKLYYVDMNAKNGFGFINELGRLKHLRKLGITNLKSQGGNNTLCNAIEQMSQLESLHIITENENELIQLQSMSSPPLLLTCLRLQGRLEKLPDWINSELKYLVRIRLFWSQLSDLPLKTLGELPMLLELSVYKGYNGAQLHFEDGYFPVLKELSLEGLDRLNKLIIDEKALCFVENLYIGSCPRLEELPSDICHMECLKQLEISEMSKEFARKVLPDVGQDHWKVQRIANVFFYFINTKEQYSTYKLGDSNLLEYLS